LRTLGIGISNSWYCCLSMIFISTSSGLVESVPRFLVSKINDWYSCFFLLLSSKNEDLLESTGFAGRFPANRPLFLAFSSLERFDFYNKWMNLNG
jgi:hypothetical protein